MSNDEFDNYLTLLAKLLRLGDRQRQSIAGELRAHLEDRLDELLARGVPRQEAVKLALAEFGDAAGLAAEFVSLSRNRRRRWIMRLTTASAAAIVLVAAGIFTFWPGTNAGPGQAALVAQAPGGAPGSAGAPGAGGPPGTTGQPHGAAQALSLEERLNQRIDAEFVETPLKDVVDHLQGVTGITFYLKAAKLEEAGVNIDIPVTKNFKQIRLSTLLDLMLEELGLVYSQKDDLIIFTTPNDADATMEVRVYDCRDLLAMPTGLPGRPGMGMGMPGMPGMMLPGGGDPFGGPPRTDSAFPGGPPAGAPRSGIPAAEEPGLAPPDAGSSPAGQPPRAEPRPGPRPSRPPMATPGESGSLGPTTPDTLDLDPMVPTTIARRASSVSAGTPGYLGLEADEAARVGSGVLISHVRKGAPAEQGGLRDGDLITAIDGKPCRNLAQLDAAMTKSLAGAKCEFTIQRDWVQETKVVTFGRRSVAGGDLLPALEPADDVPARPATVPRPSLDDVLPQVGDLGGFGGGGGFGGQTGGRPPAGGNSMGGPGGMGPGMMGGAGLPGGGTGGGEGRSQRPLSEQDHKAEQLMDIITTAVDPSGWSDQGGPGTIGQYNGLIVVSQSSRTHAKIEKVLDMLRDAAGLPKSKEPRVVR